MNKNLLQHIAVIPDGNRRWARTRGLFERGGHREGIKRFREISEEAFRLKIPFLTFWAASEDNFLKRSRVEVRYLLSLLENELMDESLFNLLKSYGVKLKVIGRWREIIKAKGVKQAIENLEQKTSSFKKRRLTILLGYDGKREIVEAVKSLCQEKPESINAETVKRSLWTADLPPVDLVIRTGGEPHWSGGFLMWLTADSQLHFTRRFWPEFGAREFKEIIDKHTRTERRFGK